MKILAVIAVMLTAGMAFGAVQDFGKFTVDAPDGWTANQYDATVNINKDDETAYMSLVLDSWMITGVNGERTYAMFDVYGRNYMLTLMTGFESAMEEFSAMLRSINVK